MTRKVLLVDLAIAIVAAIVVLTLTPGLAIAGLIAIVVLIACAISFRRDSRRKHAAGSGPRDATAREQARQRRAAKRSNRTRTH